MTLQEYISQVRGLDQIQPVWELTLAFFHARGVKMVSYRRFTGLPDPEEVPVIDTDGFPKAFLEKVMEEKLYLMNPIPELAARSTEPLFWSDVAKMTTLIDGESEFLRRVLEEELGDGLAIQVFGPMSRNGLFQLGFGGERPPITQREVREMQLAAQLAHLTYCKIVPAEGDEDPHGLTAREREVLGWIAKGKSNSVIAEILGISVHTIDTHVRRIFRKLEVNDRTTAAVKGVGAGLLQPAA